MSDLNVFDREILYDELHNYWSSELLEFWSESIGVYSEEGVWNWAAVQGGATPKYKIQAGTSYYRYVMKCGLNLFDSSRLGVFWAEGRGYASQEDADADANAQVVVIDASRIVTADLIPRPVIFEGTESGPGVATVEGDNCVGGFYSFSGVPMELATTTVAVSESNSLFHCCDLYTESCDNTLLRYGSDDLGNLLAITFADFSGGNSWGVSYQTPIIARPTTNLMNCPDFNPANCVPSTGDFSFQYAFYANETDGVYCLMLTCGVFLSDKMRLMASAGSTQAETMVVIFTVPFTDSCNPLSVEFDMASPISTTLDGAISATPYAGYSSPFPFESITVDIGAYDNSTEKLCTAIPFHEAAGGWIFVPLETTDLTLSWERSSGNGSDPLVCDNREWLGRTCIDAGVNVPDGFADSGQPAMVLFGFVPMDRDDITQGFRITILEQGDCPTNGVYPPNAGEVYNVVIPFDVDAQVELNGISDYAADPFFFTWTPSVTGVTAVTSQELAARQFLIDAGFTSFTVTR